MKYIIMYNNSNGNSHMRKRLIAVLITCTFKIMLISEGCSEILNNIIPQT